MAPNLQEVSAVLQTIDLSHHVKHQYPTLTSAVSEEYQSTSVPVDQYQPFINAAHAKDSNAAEGNYWAWPSRPEETDKVKHQKQIDEAKRQKLVQDNGRRALIEWFVQEEEHRQLLSADHVVDTLKLGAALRSNECSDEMIVSEETKEDEEYWNMPGEKNMVMGPHIKDPFHPMHKHWDWDTPPNTAKQQQMALIEMILKEEDARIVTSADHIQQSLEKEAARWCATTTLPTKLACPASSGRYWDW